MFVKADHSDPSCTAAASSWRLNLATTHPRVASASSTFIAVCRVGAPAPAPAPADIPIRKIRESQLLFHLTSSRGHQTNYLRQSAAARNWPEGTFVSSLVVNRGLNYQSIIRTECFFRQRPQLHRQTIECIYWPKESNNNNNFRHFLWSQSVKRPG